MQLVYSARAGGLHIDRGRVIGVEKEPARRGEAVRGRAGGRRRTRCDAMRPRRGGDWRWISLLGQFIAAAREAGSKWQRRRRE